MTIDAPTAKHREALRALWQEAFGDTDAFLDSFEKSAFSPDRCRCITEGNKVLAALYWFDCELKGKRIAYLYAIATAKSHRGCGLCRALMENTHAHLSARGYVGTLLVPSEPSLFAFYEKLGYRPHGFIGELACRTSSETIELRKIDTEEYAALRRKLLPENGVLQENENLAFLATMADLYAGDDFLLAARREETSLHGLELLGNTEKAPAILATLGCTVGNFRIQNGETPFAMYHPLAPKAPIPTYLGLAFD